MSKVNIHPDHLRKSGGKLKNFGDKVSRAGEKLEQTGQNLDKKQKQRDSAQQIPNAETMAGNSLRPQWCDQLADVETFFNPSPD